MIGFLPVIRSTGLETGMNQEARPFPDALSGNQTLPSQVAIQRTGSAFLRTRSFLLWNSEPAAG